MGIIRIWVFIRGVVSFKDLGYSYYIKNEAGTYKLYEKTHFLFRTNFKKLGGGWAGTKTPIWPADPLVGAENDDGTSRKTKFEIKRWRLMKHFEMTQKKIVWIWTWNICFQTNPDHSYNEIVGS